MAFLHMHVCGTQGLERMEEVSASSVSEGSREQVMEAVVVVLVVGASASALASASGSVSVSVADHSHVHAARSAVSLTTRSAIIQEFLDTRINCGGKLLIVKILLRLASCCDTCSHFYGIIANNERFLYERDKTKCLVVYPEDDNKMIIKYSLIFTKQINSIFYRFKFLIVLY